MAWIQFASKSYTFLNKILWTNRIEHLKKTTNKAAMSSKTCMYTW